MKSLGQETNGGLTLWQSVLALPLLAFFPMLLVRGVWNGIVIPRGLALFARDMSLSYALPLVAAVCASGTLFVWWRIKGARSDNAENTGYAPVRRSLVDCANGIALAIVAGAIGVLSAFSRGESGAPGGVESVAAILAVAGLVLACYGLFRSGVLESISEGRFLAGTCLAGGGLGLVAILVWDMALTSDWASYHRCAVELLESPKTGWELAKHAMSNRSIWVRRAFVNVYPWYALFGPHHFVYEGVNVVLHVGTGLLAYSVFRRSAFRHIARTGLALFVLLPFPYAFLNFPNHDIAGCFTLALIACAVSVISAQLRGRRVFLPAVLGIAVGVLLVVMDLQRSYAIFARMALLVTALYPVPPLLSRGASTSRGIALRQYGLRVVIMLVIPLLVFTGLKGALSVGGYSSDRLQAVVYSYNNIGGSGKYWDGYDNINTYFSQIRAEGLQTEYATGKYLTQLRDNLPGHVALLWEKSLRLQNYGVDVFWWAPNALNVRKMALFMTGNRLVVGLVCLLGVVGLWAFRTRLPWGTAVGYFVLFLFAEWGVLLVSEVCPRYFHPMILFLPWLAASGVQVLLNMKRSDVPTIVRRTAVDAGKVALIGGCVIAAGLAVPLAAKATGLLCPRTFLAFEKPSSELVPSSGGTKQRAPADNRTTKLKVVVPVGERIASVTSAPVRASCWEGERVRLFGFLRWTPEPNHAAEVEIDYEKETIWKGELQELVAKAKPRHEDGELVYFLETDAVNFRAGVPFELKIRCTGAEIPKAPTKVILEQVLPRKAVNGIQ